MEVQFPFASVRTVFISDVHLGSRFAKAGLLAGLLEQIDSRFLYLVGDFWDGWLLKRRWIWPPSYSRLLNAIGRLAERGCSVRFLPGNHDRNCAALFDPWFAPEVYPQFFHRCADGRELLVLHGDRFDLSQRAGSALIHQTAVLHEYLLAAGQRLSLYLGPKRGYARIGTLLTVPWKLITQLVSRFKLRAVKEARRFGCDGILCGHVHSPQIQKIRRTAYINTGDWLENCSLVVETVTGQLELWRASWSRLSEVHTEMHRIDALRDDFTAVDSLQFS